MSFFGIATEKDIEELINAQTRDYINQGDEIRSLREKVKRLNERIFDMENLANNHRHAKYERKKEAVPRQKK